MAYDDVIQEDDDVSEKELLDNLPHPFAVRHLDKEQLKRFIETVRQSIRKRKGLQKG
jgi:hypothetical protein